MSHCTPKPAGLAGMIFRARSNAGLLGVRWAVARISPDCAVPTHALNARASFRSSKFWFIEAAAAICGLSLQMRAAATLREMIRQSSPFLRPERFLSSPADRGDAHGELGDSRPGSHLRSKFAFSSRILSYVGVIGARRVSPPRSRRRNFFAIDCNRGATGS